MPCASDDRPGRRADARVAPSGSQPTATGTRVVLLLCLLFASLPASAYRPFDGTDADLVERGEWEFEIGPWGRTTSAPGAGVSSSHAVFNYGLAPGWELVSDDNWTHAADGGRASLDAQLAVKHLVREGTLQQGTGPSVAFELALLAPGDLSEPGVGASAALIASQRWRGLTVHVNALAGITREHDPDLLASVILEGSAWRRVRPVTELLVERTRDETRHSALLGLIWAPREGMSLDLAVRHATQGGTRVNELRCGITFSLAAR